MFRLFKRNRLAVNTRFSSYERARQFARKLIRQNNPGWRSPFALFYESNPPIGAYGFQIRKVG